MRIFLSFLAVFVASDAAACIRNPVGFSFEDKISNEFSYLICLHNEQNDALRKLAKELDRSSAELESENTARMMLEGEVRRLKDRVLLLEIQSARSSLPPEPVKRTPEEKAELDKIAEEMRRLIEKKQHSCGHHYT